MTSEIQAAGPIRMSPTVGELFAAVAKAQTSMTVAGKDREVVERRTSKKTGSTFETKRSYATLASTLEACRPHLAAEGVSLTQWPTRDDSGNVQISTILGHASGEWMCGTFSTDTRGLQQQGVQALGSAISYLRRYCAQAVCGVAQADEDDDGAAASQAPKRPAPKKRAQRKPAPKKPANPDHHASWTEKVRVDFCSNLPKTFGGLTYKDLAAFLQAHGDPRPSAMSQEDRVTLWRDLQGGKSADVVEWCAIQAAAKGAA